MKNESLGIPGNGFEYIKMPSNENNFRSIVISDLHIGCIDSDIKLIDSVYFIPLTIENAEDQIGRYFDIDRKESIDDLIYNNLHNGQFEFHKKNLPPHNIYPIKLNQKTILLRKIPDEEDISVTISLGVYQYQTGDYEKTFIRKADEALYKAKENGRNRVEIYA